MKFIVLAALLATSLVAQAQSNCFGGDTFKTCTDSSGNSYTVQKFGNTTTVQGSNAATGSQWNQTSQTYGNMTQQNGTAANGQTWNSTTMNSPGMQQRWGTDSNGRTFQQTCTAAGCF